MQQLTFILIVGGCLLHFFKMALDFLLVDKRISIALFITPPRTLT
jgi:hypothetical protein